jgi:hypothetical protein
MFEVLIVAFTRSISNITMKRVLEILLSCIFNLPATLWKCYIFFS